jgi:predicted nucleotidyltransferase
MSLRVQEWDLAVRESLRDRVIGVLSDDQRVERVVAYGSLAAGTADALSDIDLTALLRPGTTDREYFLELPAVMDAVGPRLIDGMGFAALPGYVGTFYFEGVPLFWHVDIGVMPADAAWHVDSADLAAMTRWEQRFKMWIVAVKHLLRAEGRPAGADASTVLIAYLEDMKTRIAKRMDLSPVAGTPRDQLTMLLDMEIAWHERQGMGSARVFEACRALRRDALT